MEFIGAGIIGALGIVGIVVMAVVDNNNNTTSSSSTESAKVAGVIPPVNMGLGYTEYVDIPVEVPAKYVPSQSQSKRAMALNDPAMNDIPSLVQGKYVNTDNNQQEIPFAQHFINDNNDNKNNKNQDINSMPLAYQQFQIDQLIKTTNNPQAVLALMQNQNALNISKRQFNDIQAQVNGNSLAERYVPIEPGNWNKDKKNTGGARLRLKKQVVKTKRN
jgi:hypothetical protein